MEKVDKKVAPSRVFGLNRSREQVSAQEHDEENNARHVEGDARGGASVFVPRVIARP
jgi:hypothetical protein